MLDKTDRLLLPIGVEIDGVRYREVVIDEMTGIDEENLASPKINNNGAKAITMLLRRCIQEIVGVVPQKTNRMGLISEDVIRNMYAADRDFLVLCIKGLSDGLDISGDVDCTECGRPQFREFNFGELDVYEWDEGHDTIVEIELPKGFYDQKTSKYYNQVKWRLPTGKTQEKLASCKRNEVASYMIASGIVSVDGLEYTPSLHDVRMLTLKDRNAFAESILECSVGVDTDLEFECGDCGSTFNKEVDIMGFFSSREGAKEKTKKVGKSGKRLRKKR
jgi:hypothetical protein